MARKGVGITWLLKVTSKEGAPFVVERDRSPLLLIFGHVPKLRQESEDVRSLASLALPLETPYIFQRKPFTGRFDGRWLTEGPAGRTRYPTDSPWPLCHGANHRLARNQRLCLPVGDARFALLVAGFYVVHVANPPVDVWPLGPSTGRRRENGTPAGRQTNPEIVVNDSAFASHVEG